MRGNDSKEKRGEMRAKASEGKREQRQERGNECKMGLCSLLSHPSTILVLFVSQHQPTVAENACQQFLNIAARHEQV